MSDLFIDEVERQLVGLVGENTGAPFIVITTEQNERVLGGKRAGAR